MDEDYIELQSKSEDPIDYNYEEELKSACESTEKKAESQKRSKSYDTKPNNASFTDIYSQCDILTTGFKLKFGTKRIGDRKSVV